MKNYTIFFITLCSCLTLSADAEVLKLDFGTEKSSVRDGFIRVTDKTEINSTSPVGWTLKGELISRDAHVKKEWTFSDSSGRNNPPRIYTSDLTQDHVESRESAVLRLRLNDGKYRLWILCGAAGGSRSQVWDITVHADGDKASTTFPGASESRTKQLQTTVTDNELEIELSTRSRWLVNAMIVAPAEEWTNIEKSLIEPIEKETFLLPEDVLAKWEHTPHTDDTPMPKFTEKEKEQGFVIYSRSYLDPIFPNTVPKRRELDPTLKAYASRDEYEPMTFTIFPLRDFDDVSVDVTDLETRDGATISREDIDVRYVRYMHVRPNYRVFGAYYRAPDVLTPMQPRALKSGENFRAWFTVHVDSYTRDGMYQGEARALSGGDVVARAPILFRVLPITLEKDRSLTYGQYYRHPYDTAASAPDAFSRRWQRKKAEYEHADMAAHGNNTITMSMWSPAPVDGKWKFTFDSLAAKIELYRRHGFCQPIPLSIPTSPLYGKYMKSSMGSHLRLIKMPPPEFFEEMTEMVRQIEEERKRRQWPEFLYYPVDEPSRSDPSVDFMVEVLKAIKKVPGVRTYVTADPTHEAFEPMMPYVDVWCCQPFNPDREVIVEDMKKRGVEYWCYPNHVAGENDHTPVAGARMTYGFGFWRSGFRALIPWIYQAIISDQWNYLDGGAMDFFNRTDDDGRPIPVTLWEAYREGIDDGRYITTLERWIERAKALGMNDQAAKAESDLKFVWDSINVQIKYKYDDLWASEAFNVYRWIIASQILKLQAAVKR